MIMSHLCIMTFWFWLADGSKVFKKHVYNSVLPSPLEQIYNITAWVRQLHLQQCALVEVGEKYCGVFVEFRSLKLQVNTELQEYFLGLCDINTLHKWKFCPPALEKERPKECIFQERTEYSDNPARVHRRLCEISDLAVNADLCDCSGFLAGQKLHKVMGFPTCFLRPLPESLCRPRNVCGIASCNASTLGRQIHIVQCNPKCLGGQPFCEATGSETSRASEIDSHWSDWHDISCDSQAQDCLSDSFNSEALCINRNTGMGAIDCLGPGTNCCPSTVEKCKCYIYTEDGVLKLFRHIMLQQIKDENEEVPVNMKYVFKQYKPGRDNRRNRKTLLHKYLHTDSFEEEYEDDDEEDENDEDIILEEDKEDVSYVSTTESSEKDEVKQIQSLSKADPQKYPLEEMTNDTQRTDEKSIASMFSGSHIIVCILPMCFKNQYL